LFKESVSRSEDAVSNGMLFREQVRSNQYSSSYKHHLHAGLKLTTPLCQASLRTDFTILTARILIITHFKITYIFTLLK